MATVLQSDDIKADNRPYVIKGLYRGERTIVLLCMVPSVLILCAIQLWKMPKPLALDNTRDLFGWAVIAFYTVVLILALLAAVLRLNTEWVISSDGVKLIRSSILGQRQYTWSEQEIVKLDVLVIGFEKGSFMYALSRRNGPIYHIRFHLLSGKTVSVKALSSRDAVARELKQISKRLPDVPCEDFSREDSRYGEK